VEGAGGASRNQKHATALERLYTAVRQKQGEIHREFRREEDSKKWEVEKRRLGTFEIGVPKHREEGREPGGVGDEEKGRDRARNDGSRNAVERKGGVVGSEVAADTGAAGHGLPIGVRKRRVQPDGGWRGHRDKREAVGGAVELRQGGERRLRKRA